MLDRIFEEDDLSLERTVELAVAIEKAGVGAESILHKDSVQTCNFTVNKLKNVNSKYFKNKPSGDKNTKNSTKKRQF